MQTVLLATLGESPVVITSMVDLLAEQAKEGKIDPIDVVEVLCPLYSNVDLGYALVEDALKARYQVKPVILAFEDANSDEDTYEFLRALARRLQEHQSAGNTVYLSLAGGRKNMSALLALVAPLYSCVKKLYHVLDKREPDSFLSIDQLYTLNSGADLHSALFPDRNHLKLIPVPYGERQQASSQFLERLTYLTPEQFNECDIYYSSLIRPDTPGRMLTVEFTEEAKEQYQKLRQTDATRARGFAHYFERMRYLSMMRGQNDENVGAHGTFEHKWHGKRFYFHFCKLGGNNEERPFYCVESQDAQGRPEGKIIICALEIERERKYRDGYEIIKSLTFPLESQPLSDSDQQKPTILLVPLGASPMVATQLYTLLQEEKHQIRKIVLLYPNRERPEIRQSRLLAQAAFDSRGIECEIICLKDYSDIDSEEACEAYQKKLEGTIGQLQVAHADCQIALALSGGRKGMAALAMFAAQRKGIRTVYHTLITDEVLKQRVFEETELTKLSEISLSTSQSRLFLDAYAKERVKDGKKTFVVFQIPIIPPQL